MESPEFETHCDASSPTDELKQLNLDTKVDPLMSQVAKRATHERTSDGRPPLLFPPFRIKTVEHVRLTSLSEREEALVEASYNLFKIPSTMVLVDLLTDSGTSAMSVDQWAALMRGDESYAQASSYLRFEGAIRRVTGLPYVLPTHQGRAAERILFGLVGGPGKIVPNNTHFDTTRANIEATGAEAMDLPCKEASLPSDEIYPFKGNMDIGRLEEVLSNEELRARVPLVMCTVTNNSGGGQPVSLENLRAIARVCRKYDVPFFLDACRFAENAYFIKTREAGCSDMTIEDIVREMFKLVDGCTMSGKKDMLANMGGFLACRSKDLHETLVAPLILGEGFPTYGGLSGRDLEAAAVGIQEVLSEDYLRHRVAQAKHLADALIDAGVPLVQPVGAHAVYIDASAFAPHLDALDYPGQALAVELYREGGIRTCEIGSVMFARKAEDGSELPAPKELVRLAIPRRVYTATQLEFVAHVIIRVFKRREALVPYRILKQPAQLRHFSCSFEPDLRPIPAPSAPVTEQAK